MITVFGKAGGMQINVHAIGRTLTLPPLANNGTNGQEPGCLCC